VDESYPHTGMHTSHYSEHKAAAEARLDEYETTHQGGMTISRVRPGIVAQRDAGAAISRYGLPAYLPTRLLRVTPILPLDRGFVIPIVHADDVADGVLRIMRRRIGGAFNLAADEPLTRADVAAVLHARAVHTPAPVLRTVVDISWRLNLQPLSPGWIDMAFAAPLESSARAKAELDWRPRTSARDAFAEVVAGMVDDAGTASPVLRPNAAGRRLHRLITAGPISRRRVP
jgi:nucleoside-diphosphate-sugar epimerase